AGSGNGLLITGKSKDIQFSKGIITGLQTAFWVERCPDITIHNSWIHGNKNGIHLLGANNNVVVNNFIEGQTDYGIIVEDACIGTVIFNNIITNNNNAQIYTTYSGTLEELVTPDGEQVFTTWKSERNFILPVSGQAFGKLLDDSVTLSYFNQKTWIGAMKRDGWGSSFCYATSFDPGEPATPTLNDIPLGHGNNTYYDKYAPAVDYGGVSRPKNKWDIGCWELAENTNLFHHVGFANAETQREDPEIWINTTVRLENSNDSLLPGMQPDYQLYIFLYSGSMVSPDTQAEITGSNINPVAGEPGLFKIAKTDFSGSFDLQVRRSRPTNSGQVFCLRIVEWEKTWDETNLSYGGRSGSMLLRWTNWPDPDKTVITASQPVLASGRAEDHSLITITVRAEDGNPMPDLYGSLVKNSDFQATISGANTSLLDNAWEESPDGSAIYSAKMSSSLAGHKTISISVMGIEINTKPMIEFLPGLYGIVSDAVSGQGLPDIRLTLKTSENTTVAVAQTNAVGAYKFLVANPSALPYILRVEDSIHLNYPSTDIEAILSQDTAREFNIRLQQIEGLAITHHVFPNPVPRGQRVTIPFDLPDKGRFTLEIYDLRGRHIITLIDALTGAGKGRIVWYGINQAGKRLAPGTYMVIMKLDGQISKQKVVLTP
ncbi:right-handed parallel beta-helix repeat-containing protein, partial [bacterium]|nr:right-handed parallel beta-helix repeat-containing protein [bacterium]